MKKSHDTHPLRGEFTLHKAIINKLFNVPVFLHILSKLNMFTVDKNFLLCTVLIICTAKTILGTSMF